MTNLLVSVRSATEAEIAIQGGAGLIDIKEPANGALGRADDATITAILETVAGRCPVSAALGELAENDRLPACLGLCYVKWGLAGLARADWKTSLQQRLKQPGPQAVIVAYADWQCAFAPPVDDVVDFACEGSGNVLLIDTHCKDAARLSLRRRPTLLDWLSIAEIIDVCTRCRQAGVRVALAGSLGLDAITSLLPAQPDWFAVRGAVCAGSDRTGPMQSDKVRALSDLFKQSLAKCAG